MRLTILPQMPLACKAGQWFCSEVTYGKYIEGIAEHCSCVVVCGRELNPVTNPLRYNMTISTGYAFQGSNLQFIPLPDHFSTNPGLLLTVRKHWETFWNLQQAIRNFDIIYIWMPGITPVMAWLLALVFRKPYFIYVSGYWPGVANALRRWRGWRDQLHRAIAKYISKLEQLAIKQAPFRLWEGNILYEEFKDDGIPNILLSTAQLSVNSFTYRNDTCRSHPIKLISVGKLVSRKGHRYLIEATAELRKQGHAIELWLVGDGEEQENLFKLTQHLGISDHVRFYGQVQREPGVLELCRQADIFVLPSFSEGFPRVITEAASQSLPIVTPNVGAIPQRLQHGVHALIVPPGDTQQLAQAIASLIMDSDLRQRISSSAYKWAQQAERTENNSIEQTIDIIKQFFPSVNQS